MIKVDGSQLTKTAYDRLGRQTHQFILAVDDDTAYADADDVTGDIVLQERQTTYESTDSDDVIMTAVIDRFHDDKGAGETTGPLDTNADGDGAQRELDEPATGFTPCRGLPVAGNRSRLQAPRAAAAPLLESSAKTRHIGWLG